MKASICAAMLLAAVSLQGTPVSAQTFTAAPGRSFTGDLDTMSGNFSVWKVTDLSGVSAVRAKLAIRRAGSDKDYAPSFRISLEDEEDSVGLRAISISKGNPKLLVVYADRIVAGKRTEEMFFTQIGVDEVLDLAIDWTPQGKVTIALTSKATRAINGAAETHTLDLGKVPKALSVSNSTSELEIIDLKAGTP